MNLHDAIDQSKFIIENRTLTDDELQAMDIDDLETLKLQIVKKITGLSASIYAQRGKSASKEWYMNRRLALSINQRVLTYVNSLIKKRHRKARSISDYFMDEAKLFLKPKEYETILRNAHREMSLLREGK